MELPGRIQTYTVKIPKGVREGQRIRLAGLGEEGGGGGHAGDLYLRVKLEKHPDFEVQDSDLFYDLEIPAWQAVLGGDVEIPTLDGRAKLHLPPGSQNGQKFRLAGRGLAQKGGGRGNFYAVLRPTLPRDISSGRESFGKNSPPWSKNVIAEVPWTIDPRTLQRSVDNAIPRDRCCRDGVRAADKLGGTTIETSLRATRPPRREVHRRRGRRRIQCASVVVLLDPSSWRPAGFPWSGGRLPVVRSHWEDRHSGPSDTMRGSSRAVFSVRVPRPAEWHGRNPRLS